ncbi:uncharacterized protein LOC109831201 [Asparagus officinalis]|uniref:uncharacterized protein LOC109831201 n=1 Tax=Asparagus officinalis TaxID=4686 RepID=UPI00098E2245|nr:uncharacterized protein LOC109831201 [Asparagus officinalis]
MSIASISSTNNTFISDERQSASCVQHQQFVAFTQASQGPLALIKRTYNPPNPKQSIPKKTKELLMEMSNMAANVTRNPQQSESDSRTREEIGINCIEKVLAVKKGYRNLLNGVDVVPVKQKGKRNLTIRSTENGVVSLLDGFHCLII